VQNNNKKSLKKSQKKTVNRKIGKAAKKIDKNKLAFQEIRKDFKRLKKSKQKMQVLWCRTKKEHVALIKDLDLRLKAVKNKISKKKPVVKRRIKKAK